MDILSRRLYNGGFNHLKRKTGSLILRIPRTIVQPPLARPMSTPHQAPLMNTNVRRPITAAGFALSSGI